MLTNRDVTKSLSSHQDSDHSQSKPKQVISSRSNLRNGVEQLHRLDSIVKKALGPLNELQSEFAEQNERILQSLDHLVTNAEKMITSPAQDSDE